MDFNYLLISRSLTLSQLDAGLKEEATKTCTRAVQLAKKYVPDRLVDLVRLQVYMGIMKPTDLSWGRVIMSN